MEISDHEAWADLGCRDVWTKLRTNKHGRVKREAAMAAINAAYMAGYMDALRESPEPILTDVIERRDALLARLPVI